MLPANFKHNFLSKGEQLFDTVCTKTKFYLPFVARLCLLSSFIQDNFVIISFWRELLELADGDTFEMFILAIIALCFVVRTIGCVWVLYRRRMCLACGLIVASTIVQNCLAETFHDSTTILYTVSVFGGLIFLVAESRGKAKTLFAGVPEIENNKPKDYLQLGGRCLVILMFFNFITLDTSSFLLVLQDVFGFGMVILVFIGYKTNLSVFATLLYLNVVNAYENNWWSVPLNESYYRMYVRHRFVQGVAVSGGLLMIVLHGPGGISIDKAKKEW